MFFTLGLTEAEIDQAIKVASKVQPPPASPAAATTPPSAVPPPLPPRALAPVQPVQRYRPRTWGEYAMVTAVVGGVGYALYHFVRVIHYRTHLEISTNVVIYCSKEI